MIIAVKETLNAVCMYVYLAYYRRKLNRDFTFMVMEALEHNQDLRD